MVDFFALLDGLGKSVQSKVGQQQVESGDHRYQAEIGGRQQASQYHRRDHLNDKAEPSRQQSGPRSPDRELPLSPWSTAGRKLPLASNGLKIAPNQSRLRHLTSARV